MRERQHDRDVREDRSDIRRGCPAEHTKRRRPAAQAVAEIAQRAEATRVFLMASHTLSTKTDEIDRVRQALGNRCAATYAWMPPHTPRQAVIAAADQARAAKADLIVTVGGGSIT